MNREDAIDLIARRTVLYMDLYAAVNEMQLNAEAVDGPTQIVVRESDWIAVSVAMAAIEEDSK
jgi:hypothetical protein